MFLLVPAQPGSTWIKGHLTGCCFVVVVVPRLIQIVKIHTEQLKCYKAAIPDALPTIVAHLQLAADVHAEPDAETVA